MTTHIDIHIIQSVPPSNINRDDTGSPKTAIYGGARRARVSSQAWKRATRRDFETHLDRSEVGVRTQHVAEMVARILTEQHGVNDELALTQATAALGAAGFKAKAKRDAKEGAAPLTEYLVFFSHSQIEQLAQLVANSPDGKVSAKDAKAALDTNHSFDLALFGRMVANDTSLNVDAACQVAHALSTHAVETEYDYYTAVDDHRSAEERTDAGAGMVGTIEFDSSTLYRYATVNVDALHATLGDPQAAVRALEAFVRSFALSMPTGKANTFANQTVPDAIVVTARSDRPVSLVGAFEVPVRSESGYVTESCRALASYSAQLDEAYGRTADHTWVTAVGGAATSLVEIFGAPVSLGALIADVADYAGQRLAEQA